MRIRIDREIRREAMSKATKVERYLIMARDLARCRSPRRAYDFIMEVIDDELKDDKNDCTQKELTILEKEKERISQMSPEDFYEELKRLP